MISRVVILLTMVVCFSSWAFASETLEIKAEPYVKTNTRVGQLAFFKTYQQSFKSAGNVTELTLEEGQTFKKGDVLLKEGGISNECYFIIKGCIRNYFLKL